MADPLPLLEFVGLALPAVAILIQVIQSTHDNTGDGARNEGSAERRFIEVSFVLLVIAGVVFGAALLLRTQDLLMQVGIVVLLFGLILLAPATWIALNRPRFPYSRFNSPEEAATAILRTVSRIALPVVFLVAVAVLITVWRPWGFSVPGDVAVSQLLSIVVLLLVIIGTVTGLDLYLRYQRSEDQRAEHRQRTRKRLRKVENRLPESTGALADDRLHRLSRDATELNNQLEALLAEAEEDDRFDGEVRVADLVEDVDEVAKLADRLRTLRGEIDEYETSIVDAEREIKSRQRKLEGTDDSTERKELTTELDNLRQKQKQIESALEGKRDAHNQTESDLRDLLGGIHKQVRTLQDSSLRSDT